MAKDINKDSNVPKEVSKLDNNRNIVSDLKGNTPHPIQSNPKPFDDQSKNNGEKETDPIHHGYVADENDALKTRVKKVAFLDNFNRFVTPAHTCQAIGIAIPTFYLWLHNDQAFADAYQIVERHLTDRLVRIATSRAIRGSDNLLMFMLKARDPRYREKLQAEFDPKQVEALVRDIVTSLRKSVPNNCPHCKKDLKLSEKVEQMLVDLTRGAKF